MFAGVGITPVVRQTEWITPYSGHASTFRSQTPNGVSHEPRTTQPS
jgi:hypothetical protein